MYIVYAELPQKPNMISSHHLFQVETDREGRKLKFKYPFSLHGNYDQDKDIVQKDSAVVKFPIICIVLSLAAILSFLNFLD